MIEKNIVEKFSRLDVIVNDNLVKLENNLEHEFNILYESFQTLADIKLRVKVHYKEYKKLKAEVKRMGDIMRTAIPVVAEYYNRISKLDEMFNNLKVLIIEQDSQDEKIRIY